MWNHYQQLAKHPWAHFTKNTDTKHLQTLIAACEESTEADSMASVPIDVTWVDGLADLKFPTPDVSALLALPPDPTKVEEHPPLHHSDGMSPSGGGNLDVSYNYIYIWTTTAHPCQTRLTLTTPTDMTTIGDNKSHDMDSNKDCGRLSAC